jgi:hypothetical protein
MGFCPDEYATSLAARDMKRSAYAVGVPKVISPFGTLISFGSFGFCFAPGQGGPTEKTDGRHNCFSFFGVKRVPVQKAL